MSVTQIQLCRARYLLSTALRSAAAVVNICDGSKFGSLLASMVYISEGKRVLFVCVLGAAEKVELRVESVGLFFESIVTLAHSLPNTFIWWPLFTPLHQVACTKKDIYKSSWKSNTK